ncbi:MAG TPA: protein translocase subunit SecD [Solirubrobacteraceae bacterium]
MSVRRRSLLILLLVFGLVAGSIAVIATKKTQLGLDLQGGVQLIYEGKPTKAQPTVNQAALDRSLTLLRQRVDAFGVAEPEIRLAGDKQIEVSLPGVEDVNSAVDQIGSTAQLFLYDWEKNVLDEDCKTNPDEPQNGQSAVTGLYNAVQRAAKCDPRVDANNSAADRPRVYVFDKANKPVSEQTFESEADARDSLDAKQLEGAKFVTVPEGILVLRAERGDPDKNGKVPPAPDRWYLIDDNPALSGTDIKDPKQEFDERAGNLPIVTFKFTDKGRKAFQNTTRAIAIRGQDNAPPGADPVSASQHFAIALDNELVSTPYINYRENPDGIDGVNGAQISGGFTIDTAQNLAQLLEIGALPLRLELVSRSQVSATLGKQALDQGLTAGIGGFIVVALFLLVFYRVLGVIATATLAVYALYFYALVKLIPITLTLPGIAGLILTLGVAADANIVIFERIKEEIRAGRSVGTAIASGYKKAIGTIIDANVVTLLVAFVLFLLAAAGVRGFAFTLGIGVAVSLFTAVLATQAILLALSGTRLLSGRAALGAREREARRKFDFMGASRYFFSASGIILLIGALAIAGKGLNFGIDFESGSRITAPLAKAASVDQVREALRPVGFGDAEIQTIDNPDLGKNVVQVSVEKLNPQDNTVTDALNAKFGSAGDPNVETIGPSFGRSVARSALYAIIASLLIIGVYITLRFEWKYAVPVLIALMHDLLITAGVYALVGQEVTTSTVAALLTILGFSLYDTIIVFDRVRENVPRMPSAAFSQIVNRSMSEVIVRSLATSFCALLPILSLFLFGGETLRDFAFALIVGTLSGTYSSVFIASPVLCHWKEREAVYAKRESRIKAEHGGIVPAYAVATAGVPADVAPSERGGRRGRITAPSDPANVSNQEFEDMVRNLGVESGQAAAAAGPSVPGGRRAARRAGNGDGEAAPKPEPKPKSPAARKVTRKHGRAR